MSPVTQHAPGTFSWADLGTTDAPAAKEFYTSLFGWTAVDTPAGEAGTYTMLELDGQDVAALYDMEPEKRAQGIPPHWTSYVTVASADEAAARAAQLGGTVVAPPFDVMDAGRMAVIQDPTGAILAVWEPRSHNGAAIVGQPGSLCWNELGTRDLAAATEFYTQLFGWTAQAQDMGEFTYTIFQDGEQLKGGMYPITPEMGDMPPNWMVYFAVEDCDRSAERARELGGQVHVPPTDIPQAGRFAMLQDPQGALFSIIKLQPPA